MLDAVQKATGTGAEDWKITNVPVDEAIASGNAEFQAGNFRGLLDVLYGNNFKPGMGGLFEDKSDNEVLGLEYEDLDAVVKGIVENLKK